MLRINSVLSAQILRYYAVGVFNTLFSYGLYALLLTAGLQLYAAQLVAHVMGTIFNYFTYSRNVFDDKSASKVRFLASYVINYVIGLAALMVSSSVISSDYLAGFVALLIASAINFVILKRFVFTGRSSREGGVADRASAR